MHAIKNFIFQLCTIAIACSLLLFAKASPHAFFLSSALKTGEKDSTGKDSAQPVNYVGTLSQYNSQELFDINLELKVKGSSVTGKLTMTSNTTTNISTFFVSGRITSAAISFNDEYVVDESGGAAWCKKKYVGTIDASGSGIIKGTWQNDGNLYFQNKRLLQGAVCRPGTFVLRKVNAAN